MSLNHSLDELFEGRMIKLKYKPKKKKKGEDTEEDSDSSDEELELDDDGLQDIIRPVAVCRDPHEFVSKVMMDRNMTLDETDIKIGADDGQGLFKINIQLLSNEKQTEPTSRAKYSDVSWSIFALANGCPHGAVEPLRLCVHVFHVCTVKHSSEAMFYFVL